MDYSILTEDLHDLYCRIESARILLNDGKQIQSYTKLQGALTKCLSIANKLHELATKNSDQSVIIREPTNGNG